MDTDGNIERSITWEKRRFADHVAGWHLSGDFFFVALSRQQDNRVQLNYYRTDTGELTDFFEFDPLTDSPYDHDVFAGISLETLDLVNDLTRARGTSINSWRMIWFDKPNNRLILSGLRPVGAPYDHDGKLICKMEEQFLAVTLAK